MPCVLQSCPTACGTQQAHKHGGVTLPCGPSQAPGGRLPEDKRVQSPVFNHRMTRIWSPSRGSDEESDFPRAEEAGGGRRCQRDRAPCPPSSRRPSAPRYPQTCFHGPLQRGRVCTEGRAPAHDQAPHADVSTPVSTPTLNASPTALLASQIKYATRPLLCSFPDGKHVTPAPLQASRVRSDRNMPVTARPVLSQATCVPSGPTDSLAGSTRCFMCWLGHLADPYARATHPGTVLTCLTDCQHFPGRWLLLPGHRNTSPLPQSNSYISFCFSPSASDKIVK